MFENPRTLGRLLIDQAERRGSKTYLYHEDLEVSYRDLLDRVERVRAGLSAAGIRGGDRLALLLTNGPEFLYAWFGAALLGAVTVPINPAYRSEEIRYILDDAGASGIVVDGARRTDIDAIRDRLPALRLRITLGEAGNGWQSFEDLCTGAEARSGAPADGARPEDAAAIIYTSGTTGHPKGVVLTHRNYHFDAWSLVTHLKTGPDDRFLCFLPLFHVNAQVVSVLSALLVGGSLVLLREFKPSTFLETVARYRATTFSAVPTVYAILNTLPDAERYDLSSLRFCICGAAPMPVEVFTTFERKFNATIVEGYGLSEATCGSCINPVGVAEKRKIGSIGVPLPGQEMKIFDDGDRELPDGQIGEIVVRGEAVMREYFRNPTATAETLRGAWLHTGDLGYRDADGYFFIVGRKKEMIIRGGENIYPKEIEEIVYRHPAVQEAAVVGVPDPIWGEIVCACVVPKAGVKVAKQEIVDLCRANLADFKVPSRVEIVESFPKTPTGKIQKGKIILT
jgi:long-chain acyl-CoA synthetase